ncbi:oxidoreductase domain protein [Beutenbergia cavernae DSM 12333]|uniref:Oxidoreductase domain protein n=1 Tax=Beutenbergia cavernae (strain ATCC BAA-8 / DSM 12333 / CCUG 43141 / JCM 11478 / NBRC 16432 / NCIMB 13614 / HKI 0122) TaxID=471853 RepID=C5BXW3_BEUC1|nr:Gfo/Idh/MocA family oxidoreductase [Beutenbergia cavernae]ACQ78857.1 oxidoreductase domain protein [Beutenbergia cavernae DSM 12333]
MGHLRIGVVGYGNRGVIAQRAAELDGDASVVAVAEPLAPGQARARRDFGPETQVVADVAGLVAVGVDAAFITSPDFLHEEHAVELLEGGVAVFVDKPLAITLDGADRILETARRTGSRLYVGHNMRHMPVIRLMRDLVADGAIGEVKAVWCRYFVGDGGDNFFKDWHADRSKVNSLLLQKASHDIDVIHWLAGGYTSRVVAMGEQTLYAGITDRADHSHQLVREWHSREDNWPPLRQTGLNEVVDVEDLTMVQMALDNGVLASYQECHYTPDYWRNYTVIGTEGRLENFGLGPTGVVRVWNRRSEFAEHGDLEIPIPHVEGGHHGADPALFSEFLNFVRTGEPTQTSPVAARAAVATAALATDSMRSGSAPRQVPSLDPDLRAYFEAGQPASAHATPSR